MADDSIQNGTNGGDVPEIELIIKVSVNKLPFCYMGVSP